MNYQNIERLGVRKLRLTGLLVVAAGLLGACAAEDASGPSDPFGERTYSLAAFDSCTSLDDYIADLATEQWVRSYVTGNGYGYDVLAGGPARAEDDTAGPQAGEGTIGGESPPTSPDDFTGTNNQEVGVDEADQMKTNGDTVFYLQAGVLHIIDSWPAEEAVEVARIDLESGADRMFLVGDRLVTFGYVYEGYDYCYYGGYYGDCYYEDDQPPTPLPAEEGGTDGGSTGSGTVDPGDPVEPDPGPNPEPQERFSGTRVNIFDVSDPTNPVEVSEFDFEGYLVSARMVDGKVYVAALRQPDYDPALYEALSAIELPENMWELTTEEREALAAELRPQVRAAILGYLREGGRANFIPDRRENGERSELLSCNQIMRSGRPADIAMLVVLGFDPAVDGSLAGVGLISNGYQVYGSTTSLFIAQDSRWWWWPDPEQRWAETHIHKFDLNGGVPSYAASGTVEGWLLGQYSMSEHEGNLRVATTDQAVGGWWWGPMEGDTADVGPVGEPGVPVEPSTTATAEGLQTLEPANNVYVLAEEGIELVTVGALRGLAPNERIFAVRFMGDRGYVVTFEQVDPLFTLDLSDPANPQVLGELHILGVSSYLHPLGEDYLIGIGRDGTAQGQLLGLQLQLFDVSNPASPERIHQTLLSTGEGEWSYSQAEHDPHAFTYYPSRGLLAIPVTLESYGWDTPDYDHFSGAVVYRVSVENGFEEVGRVSHSGIVRDYSCTDVPADPEAGAACAGWDYGWWAWIQRTAFVEDFLYVFSDYAVTASSVDDLSHPVATIDLNL